MIFSVAYGISIDFILQPATPAAAQPMHIAALGLYNAVYTFIASNFVTKFNCNTFGYNIGMIISEALEAKTDSFVAILEVAKFASSWTTTTFLNTSPSNFNEKLT